MKTNKTNIIIIAIIFISTFDSFAEPLSVHPNNPRYFTDGSGRTIYLTGSHTWMNLQDFKVAGHPDFDFNEYLDFLKENNHNFIRLWVTEYEYDIDNKVLAHPTIYKRTGPENAYDGRPKYDLTKYNDEYFSRLRSRVKSAGDKGIYVSVMLFSSFGSDYSAKFADQKKAWNSHPYNKNNNINRINADFNNDGNGSELHTLEPYQNPNVIAFQKNYVKKVIDTVNDFDNVLFEIGNEMAYVSKSFQYHMINIIRDYEKTKPKQHPVGLTSGGPTLNGKWVNMSKSDLVNSPADWVSPTKTWGDITNDPPETDGTKVVILDTDHFTPQPEHRDWVWKSFCRGYNPIFMDVLQVPYPYGIGKDWNQPDNPLSRMLEIRLALGHTLTYANKMNLAEMTPESSLSSTKYCIANPGSEYLIYQPDSNSLTVHLEAGTYDYEWFNPSTGMFVEMTISVNGGSETFNPPINGYSVLYLRASKAVEIPPVIIGY